MSNNQKTFIGVGILSGIIGTACCVVPLILFAVGLGAAGATFETLLEPYSKITLVLSFVVLTAFVLLRQKKEKCTVCTIGARPHIHFPIQEMIIGFVITVVTYYLIHDVAVPFIRKTFFERELHSFIVETSQSLFSRLIPSSIFKSGH